MKTTFKNTLRILTALALCAMVSACSQPGLAPLSTANFPSYGSQISSAGQFVAPSIMDY